MQKSFKDCTEVTGAGKRWLLKARTVDIVYFEIGYFDKLGNSALYFLSLPFIVDCVIRHQIIQVTRHNFLIPSEYLSSLFTLYNSILWRNKCSQN